MSENETEAVESEAAEPEALPADGEHPDELDGDPDVPSADQSGEPVSADDAEPDLSTEDDDKALAGSLADAETDEPAGAADQAAEGPDGDDQQG